MIESTKYYIGTDSHYGLGGRPRNYNSYDLYGTSEDWDCVKEPIKEIVNEFGESIEIQNKDILCNDDNSQEPVEISNDNKSFETLNTSQIINISQNENGTLEVLNSDGDISYLNAGVVKSDLEELNKKIKKVTNANAINSLNAYYRNIGLAAMFI